MLNLEIDIDDDRVLCVEARPAGWAGEIPVRRLFDALREEGVPEPVWPGRPTDNKCLERALQSLRDRTSLVRPLPKSRGFSLVLETPDNLDLDTGHGNAHRVEITAKVERTEYGTSLKVTPESHPAIPLIRQQYEYYRGQGGDDEGLFKCSSDLSYWFSQQIIPWCSGVATRSRGGSYYVLKGEPLNRLRKVQKALERASLYQERLMTVAGGQTVVVPRVLEGGRIILKPEVGSAAAVEILIDQLIEECDKTCDDLDQKLTTNIGLRALETQKVVADDIKEKLAQFEKLLGTNLEDVRSRLEEVSMGIGMTELKLQAERDAAEKAKWGKQ